MYTTVNYCSLIFCFYFRVYVYFTQTLIILMLLRYSKLEKYTALVPWWVGKGVGEGANIRGFLRYNKHRKTNILTLIGFSQNLWWREKRDYPYFIFPLFFSRGPCEDTSPSPKGKLAVSPQFKIKPCACSKITKIQQWN